MEIWKDIKGYEGLYQVSNLGRVKSLQRKVYNYIKHEKILKNIDTGSKVVVNLRKDSKYHCTKVDTLVANEFLTNVDNKPFLNHINKDYHDCNVNNLEWCYGKELNIKDFIGKRFGYLTVTDNKRIINGQTTYKCICDCGNCKFVPLSHLHRGHNISCGKCKYSSLNRIKSTTTHGNANHRLYKIWNGMHSRCGKHKNYLHIKVCDEWKNFKPFFEWAINNGYKDNLTIDRIDFNGDYEPNNCRWATMKEQANNTCKTIFIEINGISKPLTEWAKIYNINPDTIRGRIHKGMNKVDAVIKPIKRNKK